MTRHAARTAFGIEQRMCEDARRFLRARAIGEGGAGFTLRQYTATDVTCPDCAAILTQRSPFALPTPVIPAGPKLKNPIGKAILADMRRRYGPSIDDPDWAVEA